jgi:WD40 repeat protein
MATSVEFEHSIGNTVVTNGVCLHPNGQNYLYCAGWNIGIGDLTNPHSQAFLRGHDNYITCLALSPSGRLISSGQLGDHSDIYVWDYESRRKIFSFEEHDHKVQALSFSLDEKILASIGSTEDGNLFLWDLSNGAIIASARLPRGTTCVVNGGFVRDIKRRDTRNYLMCTAGKEGVMLWNLDPYTGDMTNTRVVGDARATITREVTAITFSADLEYIYAATQSGDFMIISCKAQKIIRAVQATKLGLISIAAYDRGIVVGGGDGSLTIFDNLDFTAASRSTLDGTSVVGLSLSSDKLEVSRARVINGICIMYKGLM